MECSEVAIEEFEYELIDISWSLDYDFGGKAEPCYVADNTEKKEVNELKPGIEYDADGVPMGASMDEIRMRSKIIKDFFQQWSQNHPERKIYNEILEEDILIRNISVIEASEHSSKSYLSTIAVLSIDEILKRAKPVQRVPIKEGSSNQSDFVYLLIMRYNKDGVGTVKLTVGIKKALRGNEKKAEKVEYGISVLMPNEKLIDYSLFDSKKKRNIKKAPQKK